MAVRDVAVLVEGVTDAAVLSQLIALAGRAHNMRVAQAGTEGGKAAFASKLRALLAESGRLQQDGTFVLVRDSDHDPALALSEAQQAFAEVGLPQPADVGVLCEGEWHSQGHRFAVATAVWLVPGAQDQGNLESLMLQSLGADPRLACVDDLLACWVQHGHVLPSREGNAARQRMQLWLGQFVDSKGYVQLNTSMDPKKVTPGPWDFGHAAFAPLVEFLRGV